MPNRLATEPSLYLRQHADNPVDWYPWGDEAFARAAAEDRPVLLSVGYSSCHWCHVMAHESFEDPAVAAMMNDRFVCVKVDREERPDVDALYMQATLAMTGHGGWPMTVFLTPDRRPFFAGTYFPPRPRGGMPGFADLCVQLADAYRDRPDDVERTAAELARHLDRESAGTTPRAPVTAELLEDAFVGLARRFDPDQGGFGGAPKFPPSVVLDLLLRRAWRRPSDRNAREMAELTLLRMAAGGIHDQLGGGFHRYSVDAAWLVPHFEKMLYDNALLASAYALAWRVTGRERHREVAERTLDYLLREMRTADGGFAAAQDADSPGGEGAFFTWTPEELRERLGPEEAAVASAHWGVTPAGNFEHGRTVLHVAAPVERLTEAGAPDAALLVESARRRLRAARAERAAPARDDKVIAAWNGLTIAALADAGTILDRPDLLAAAEAAADLVLERMVVGGRLMRTYVDGAAAHLGTLDDHAAVCHGLLRLYEATFAPARLAAARRLAADMVDRFADPGGGFFFTGSDAEPLIARTRDLEDHPAPSGSSLAALVLLRIAALTGEEDLAERAAAALGRIAEPAAEHPQAFGAALVAMEALVRGGRQIAVAGPPHDPATRALVAAARRHMGPEDVLAAGDPRDPDVVAACPLLAGRVPPDGRPAAHVCARSTCAAPVTAPDALAALLAGGGDAPRLAGAGGPQRP